MARTSREVRNRLKRGTVRHPRKDGMEERVAQFVREFPTARQVYIAVAPAQGKMTYELRVEIESDVVAFSWDTHRVMRYAAVMQADRMGQLMARHGIVVHQTRRGWDPR